MNGLRSAVLVAGIRLNDLISKNVDSLVFFEPVTPLSNSWFADKAAWTFHNISKSPVVERTLTSCVNEWRDAVETVNLTVA